MADVPGEDDDTLDLTADQEVTEADASGEDGGDEGETIVTFGDEPADDADQPTDNSVIRRMREELRAAKREAAELRKQSAPAPIDLGEKPTLASCDFDEDAFEQALDAYKDRERAVEQQQTAQQAEQEEANKAWEADLGTYAAKKTALAMPDFDDVEGRVKDTLNLVQQAVLVKAAGDPALFLYAVGKTQAKLDELAKIKDPIKLAAAVARMEGSIKMARRGPPKPDEAVRGSGAMPGGADKQLEKLQKEFERTGDRSPLLNYKRELAKRGK